MFKAVAIIILLLLSSSVAFCQEVLDTEKYKDAELFVTKQGFDIQQRIQEIKALQGQQVTVYQVHGKENKIKTTYTGLVEVLPSSKLSEKNQADVLTVVMKSESGMSGAYFPLTNDKRYRIYLTAKMKHP